MTALDLPDELLVAVCQLLDPRDILKMRQCCSRLYLITQDKSLWITVAARLSQSLPLPSLARMSVSTLTELEQTTVRAVHVANQWLVPRKWAPRKINARYNHTTAVDYLRVFDNRFAIAIYAQVGAVLLWDLDGLQIRGSTRQHSWGRIMGKWSSNEAIALSTCNARFSESCQGIFLSFFLGFPNRCHLAVLYISIAGNPAQERPFRQMVVVEDSVDYSEISPTSLSPETSCVAHLSPQSKAVVLTNWKSSSSRLLSAPERPSDESFWNNSICLEVFEPYVIVVKQAHLEIYLLPAELEDREASVEMSTRLEIVHLWDEKSRAASLTLQRTDVETLNIVLAVSSPFSVVSYYILRLPRKPLDLDGLFSLQHTLLYADQSLAARNVFTGSEISLGPRGMRAAWIEKSRHNMDRDVVVLTAEHECFANSTDSKDASSGKVYKISSANFEDDPTHIACHEVTGRIVIATRGGELWVLDCWQKPTV